MAIVHYYDDPGQGGIGGHTTVSQSDLTEVGHNDFGNWNDEISSFNVVSGVWQFYEHINFGGLATQEFGPGTKGNCEEFGFPSKWISSIRLVRE